MAGPTVRLVSPLCCVLVVVDSDAPVVREAELQYDLAYPDQLPAVLLVGSPVLSLHNNVRPDQQPYI